MHVSMRQQQLIQLLSNNCRKYFLYKRTPGKVEEDKVRVRNAIHRAEQAPDDDYLLKLERREDALSNGHFTPNNKQYYPVGNWPILDLDNLVLTTMEDQLDPEARESIYKGVRRLGVFRQGRTEFDDRVLADLSDLHKSVESGFDRIKILLKESKDRVSYVRAGNDFRHHFEQSMRRRLSRGDMLEPQEHMAMDTPFQQKSAEEKTRGDEIKFLKALLELIQTLLLVQTRHLMSTEPVRLDTLGKRRLIPLRYAAMATRTGSHDFKKQIMMDAPPGWSSACKQDGRTSHLTSSDGETTSTEKSCTTMFRSRMTVAQRGAGTNKEVPKKVPKEGTGLQHVLPLTNVIKKPKGKIQESSFPRIFSKRWPTLWQGVAAAEQGCNFGRPYTAPADTTKKQRADRKKSASNIKDVRVKWASMRTRIEKSVKEEIERIDKEKMEFFETCFSSLNHLPVGRIFDDHQKLIDKAFIKRRHARQMRFLYDCEVNSSWYKELVEDVHGHFGQHDEEINALLERIRHHFKLSPTEPKYGKAKLALIVMSMPATAICHIHVQRALDFMLQKILRAPQVTLIVWLAVRGLPLVLSYGD